MISYIVKRDSRLSAYDRGNVDFPNRWERCWPIHMSLTYKRLLPFVIHLGFLAWVIMLHTLG